jgi:hypothetical protein
MTVFASLIYALDRLFRRAARSSPRPAVPNPSPATEVDQALDAIRAEFAYLRIAGEHLAAGTSPTLAGFQAALHAALDDMPADRRTLVIADALYRQGYPARSGKRDVNREGSAL